MKQIKDKFLNFIKWIKDECKDWRTFLILLCVVGVVYFPTWGGYLFYIIFKSKWCLAIATTSLAFWMGPLTPFFPLCIAITITIKKIIKLKSK